MIHRAATGLVLSGRNKEGFPVAMGWDMPKWYYSYDFFQEIESGPAQCLRIKLDKVVLDAGRWARDREPRWRDPIRTSIEVSLDQEILLAHGPWIKARDLKVDDLMQSMCGNGHATRVEAIEAVGPLECVDLIVPHLGSYVLAGVVLKALEGSNGRGGDVGVRCADVAADLSARRGGGGPASPDGPPQPVADQALA